MPTKGGDLHKNNSSTEPWQTKTVPTIALPVATLLPLITNNSEGHCVKLGAGRIDCFPIDREHRISILEH